MKPISVIVMVFFNAVLAGLCTFLLLDRFAPSSGPAVTEKVLEHTMVAEKEAPPSTTAEEPKIEQAKETTATEAKEPAPVAAIEPAPVEETTPAKAKAQAKAEEEPRRVNSIQTPSLASPPPPSSLDGLWKEGDTIGKDESQYTKPCKIRIGQFFNVRPEVINPFQFEIRGTATDTVDPCEAVGFLIPVMEGMVLSLDLRSGNEDLVLLLFEGDPRGNPILIMSSGRNGSVERIPPRPFVRPTTAPVVAMVGNVSEGSLGRRSADFSLKFTLQNLPLLVIAHANKVNIRQCASTSCPVLVTAQEKTVLFGTGRMQEGWFEILVDEHSKAYIFGDFVEPVPIGDIARDLLRDFSHKTL